MKNTMIEEGNPFLIVDPNTLHKATSGLVTGRIHIHINGRSFPEKDWNDFVVIILNWWIEEIILSISQSKDAFKCRFMDGPFSFNVKKDHFLWEIFFDESADSQGDFAGELPSSVIINDILTAAKTIINSCAERNWKDKDLEKLVSNYNTLRQMTKNLVV
ncbi:MAG: hypothetical protein ACO1O1_03705 [Adhaeribacter sp.]